MIIVAIDMQTLFLISLNLVSMNFKMSVYLILKIPKSNIFLINFKILKIINVLNKI